jgi:ubiquinone/menaquinone biosynthesis C-methylase UbiE
VVALTMRERRWRPLLVQRAAQRTARGGCVVDVGAGTGTIAIALAAARPDATVVAIDGDAKALALARRKPGAERVDWRQGLAGETGLESAGASAVILSLLLHHLAPASKLRALSDVRRVLEPGGHLLIADWGRPQDPVMRGAFGLLQLIDGVEGTRDHAAGRLPAFLSDAGFGGVERFHRLRTGFGTLELLDATA